MPDLKQSRKFLNRYGIDLPEEKLEPLVDLLHYLAERVCEQVESGRDMVRIRGDRSGSESSSRTDELLVSDVRPEKVSLKNRKMA